MKRFTVPKRKDAIAVSSVPHDPRSNGAGWLSAGSATPPALPNHHEPLARAHLVACSAYQILPPSITGSSLYPPYERVI